MSSHVHVGFADCVQFALMLIIVGFIIRTISAKTSDTALGKALAYIY